jgi:hypothetical protein
MSGPASESESVTALDQQQPSTEANRHDRSDEAADVPGIPQRDHGASARKELVRPAEPKPRYEPASSDEGHSQTTTKLLCDVSAVRDADE